MSHYTTATASILAMALLCACSTQDPSAPAAPSAETPQGLLGEAAEAARKDTTREGLPPVDAARPLDQYTEVDDGEDLMFLYLATTGLPPQYEKAAEAISADYRNTSDSFRKRDLLKALTPQIDQQLAAAKNQPYRWMEIENADLGPFDFQRGGFPVGEFAEGKYRYFNTASDYKLTWENHAAVGFAPVPDEATARAIEEMRSGYSDRPRLKVYFMGRSADLNETAVKGHVTKVQIIDKTGRVLAEYGAS